MPASNSPKPSSIQKVLASLPGSPSKADEIPAIAYLLETLDSDLAELQNIQLNAATIAQQKGFFLLSTTFHEMAADTITHRIKMITWGLNFGLTGTNTEDVLNDFMASRHQLPDIFHERIVQAVETAQTYLRDRRHTP